MIFFFVPLAILLLWQILGDGGAVSGAVMPVPTRIAAAFLELLKDGELAENVGASMARVLVGFFFGTFAGLFIGIITGIYPRINQAVAAVFGILRPIPMIGLVPLMILWFGIGEKSKIIVIAVGTFWSVLINTQEGVFSVSSKLIEVAELLEKDKITVLTRIILPAAFPSIVTGIDACGYQRRWLYDRIRKGTVTARKTVCGLTVHRRDRAGYRRGHSGSAEALDRLELEINHTGKRTTGL